MATFDLDWLTTKLEEGSAIKFVRFGDGDFLTMDSQPVTYQRADDSVAEALREAYTLDIDGYYVGDPFYDCKAFPKWLPWMREIRDRYGMSPTRPVPFKIILGPLWHARASFGRFIRHIREQPSILIANKKIVESQAVCDAIRPDLSVEIPARNAACHFDSIEASVERLIDSKGCSMVLAAAGPVGKIIAAHLAELDIAFLDLGSVLDWFAKLPTRSYIREKWVDRERIEAMLREPVGPTEERPGGTALRPTDD